MIKKENGENTEFEAKHTLSDRQITVLLKGGIINEFKERLKEEQVQEEA